jgi:hypothetical protein
MEFYRRGGVEFAKANRLMCFEEARTYEAIGRNNDRERGGGISARTSDNDLQDDETLVRRLSAVERRTLRAMLARLRDVFAD